MQLIAPGADPAHASDDDHEICHVSSQLAHN